MSERPETRMPEDWTTTPAGNRYFVTGSHRSLSVLPGGGVGTSPSMTSRSAANFKAQCWHSSGDRACGLSPAAAAARPPGLGPSSRTDRFSRAIASRQRPQLLGPLRRRWAPGRTEASPCRRGPRLPRGLPAGRLPTLILNVKASRASPSPSGTCGGNRPLPPRGAPCGWHRRRISTFDKR